MKPIYCHYQKTKEDNFWKVIGQLQMVQLLQSLGYIIMYVNPLRYLKIGYALGLVTLVIALLVPFIGLR